MNVHNGNFNCVNKFFMVLESLKLVLINEEMLKKQREFNMTASRQSLDRLPGDL